MNALRAFEAAARHLSMKLAAEELHVTPGALSHQIAGLEELLGVKLFERHVRSITLTHAGARLYPGLRTAFLGIKEAVEAVGRDITDRALVISVPPGFTSKWLAPRLYRFSAAHPEIDARISSSKAFANFTNDGVDIAVRSLASAIVRDPELMIEELVDLFSVAVCSPGLMAARGPFTSKGALETMPLIHDESTNNLHGSNNWPAWFEAAGARGVDVSRGLRFNSADHALDATLEGAGVLLTYDILAYDDLRTGRLAVAYPLIMESRRCYALAYPTRRRDHSNVRAFRDWIRQEIDALDWTKWRSGLGRQIRPDRSP
jgi:LysR family glycine cleavage system transcriptional activator